MSEEKSDLVEITGLWLNKKNDGEQYFTGKMGSANVVIFKNKYKKEKNHPDYKMFVSKPKKKEQSSGDFA